MNRAESAAANIASGRMNCSQSVLTAFAEEQGLQRDMAVKLALGFGGGMGITGRTCGAVTGAYMVIGIKYKYQKDIPQENKTRVHQLIKEFDLQFSQINGSTVCQKLLGYDLSTKEGYAAAKEKGLFSTACPKFVKDAVEIIEKLM
jgi:C_GCAxxG_C_C family probable redox protein